jgi:[acyl-carrier-protein] S-malonyltransferase
MIGLVFPGQGIQRKGMGEGLFERYPDIVRTADGVLGWSVAETCTRGETSRLTDTRYAQPAVFLVNALHLLARAEAGSRDYGVYAGHSLGEFNALVAAGVLELEAGLRLVRDRALAMARVTGGGMTAVIGLPGERVEQVLRGSGLTDVYLANRNSDRQTTVAGESRQLALAARLFKAAGAAQVQPLRVSGPFHTPLMAPARADFEAAVRRVEFAPGHAPVISSITGDVFDPADAARLLTRQLVGPVDWVGVVHRLRELGVTAIDEVGGTTLTAMIRGIR